MNRSFLSVIAGGFGADRGGRLADRPGRQRPWKRGSAEDAAFLLERSRRSVIIIPGYGMAVAQAQHVLREMGDLLKKKPGSW